ALSFSLDLYPELHPLLFSIESPFIVQEVLQKVLLDRLERCRAKLPPWILELFLQIIAGVKIIGISLQLTPSAAFFLPTEVSIELFHVLQPLPAIFAFEPPKYIRCDLTQINSVS